MVELSIVVPTHNRLERLKRVVRALEQQSYPMETVEVIIVSDGSTDGTNEFLRTHVTPLHFSFVIQDSGGPAKARNSGIARAQGEYVLFIDDDVVPSQQLIAEHMRLHHAATKETVVLGPMLTPGDFAMLPWVRWEQAMLMKQYNAMLDELWKPTARQFYTGNTSLRRAPIIELGGFDENFRRAEDVELAYRLNELNVEFVFNPQAIGYHYAERSFASWLEIPYVYGRNDVIFAQKRGQVWLLPRIREEFTTRNGLIRALVRTCLNRPRLSGMATWGLGKLAAVGDRLHLEPITRGAYSGLFNLRYYQGFTDCLGDASFFFRPLPATDQASALINER